MIILFSKQIIRLFCITSFTFFSSSLIAQYYIEGVATADLVEFKVDELKFEADSLYNVGDYIAALSKYEVLKENWKPKSPLLDASTKHLQNYFYTEIIYNKVKFRLGYRSEAYQALGKLQSDIAESLGPDHLIFGMYYHEIGLMTFQHTDELESSFIQTTRATHIREEKLSEYKKDLGWSYNNLAVIADQLYGIDSSLYYQFKALEIRKEIVPVDPAMLLVSYSNISQDYLELGDHKLERDYLLKAKLVGKDLEPDHPYNLMVNTNLTKLYRRDGEFRNALTTSKYVLSLRKKQAIGEGQVSLRDNYQAVADNYLSLGYRDSSAMYLDTIISILHKYNENYAITLSYIALARTKEDKNEAIEVLKRAITICDSDSECTKLWKADIYHDIGKNYLQKNDPYEALIYALKAKEIYNELPIKDDMDHVFLYKTLATIASKLGDPAKAIKYLESSIILQKSDSLNSNFWIVETQMRLASLYSSDGQFDKAETVFNNMFSFINDNPNISSGILRDAYMQYSLHYQNAGDIEKSLELGLKSKSYLSGNEAENILEAGVAIRLHNAHIKKGDTIAAKNQFREACQLLGIESWLNRNYKQPSIPSYKLIASIEKIIDLYEFDNDYLYANNESLIRLIKAIVGLIDECRNNYFYHDSEQHLHEIEKNFYDLVIDQLYGKYDIRPNEKILEVILMVMGKSRSIGIGRINNRQQLVNSGVVPFSIISEENRINSQSEKAFQEYRELSKDTEDYMLLDLTRRLDQLNKDKNSLVDLIRKEHPDYFNERYQHKVTNLHQTRKVSNQQDIGFLSYYEGYKKLYALLIAGDKTHLKTLELEKTQSLLMELKSMLSSYHHSGSEQAYTADKRSFINLSRKLFEELIGENIFSKVPHELVVIPDGQLQNLPFEVLLTTEPKPNSDYRSLPYLIKSNVISYNSSLAQYQYEVKRPIGDNYHGYAPVYKETNFDFKSDQSLKSLLPLERNIDEVRKSAQLFKGREYIGEDAKVETFMESFQNLDILHLAMHTSLDDRIPLDSYLHFYQDSINDGGRLYAHEIGELNIDADLVVLSACETNVGKSVKGEAIRGIAKSFFVASCPNLMITNWLVDDHSSNTIIYNFLQGIRNGVIPSFALRNAKLSFLNSCSDIHTHPSYWAPYTYYGGPAHNIGSSVLSFRSFALLGLFCLIIFLLIVLWSGKI